MDFISRLDSPKLGPNRAMISNAKYKDLMTNLKMVFPYGIPNLVATIKILANEPAYNTRNSAINIISVKLSDLAQLIFHGFELNQQR